METFFKKGKLNPVVFTTIAISSVIGLSMIPAITGGVLAITTVANETTSTANVTGTSAIMVGLVSMVFVAGLVLAIYTKLMKK